MKPHEIIIKIDGAESHPFKCPPGTIITIVHPDGAKAFTKIIKEEKP